MHARAAASWRRFSLFLALVGAAALFFAAAEPERAFSRSAEPAKPVLVAALTGPIGPASARHVATVVEAADARGVEALIIELDTPGGLVTSMREIITTMLAAETPVVVYVSPAGGRAASAGAFILYASHVAAMAPATNVGAATPIRMGGTPFSPRPGAPDAPQPDDGPQPDDASKEGRDGGASEDENATDGSDAPDGAREEAEGRPAAPSALGDAKAVNDAAAYIRSLAELRGRNADWAERAVRDAASLSADEALARGVIELMADDLDALLAALDGRVVTIAGESRALQTAGAPVERLEPSLATKLLSVLANPNVAFLLMTLGFYGLLFELSSPGFGPGAPGAICLVLGLYALNQLPLDYAGLALIVLGVGFMAAEAVTPSFGALGLGGVIAFILGATMLIDTDAPEFQISWSVILAVAAASALILILALGVVWRGRRGRRAGVGSEGLLGADAEILDWSPSGDGGSSGHVWTQGERWRAVGAADLSVGQKVEVTAVDGLVLTVGAPKSARRAGAKRKGA